MLKVIIDFDGTLCQNAYPEIGEPRAEVIAWCARARGKGVRLILYTCREDRPGQRPLLAEARLWCRAQGLDFDSANENLPDIIEEYGGDCRKIFADLYIGDAAIRPGEIDERVILL